MFSVKDQDQQKRAVASGAKSLDGQTHNAPQVREPTGSLWHLQRHLGNGYLQAINPPIKPMATGDDGLRLQRACACGSPCANCAAKGDDKPILQPKLTVGAPNDRYEQEADRVADQIMRMSEPTMQRQIEPEEEEKGMVQRKGIADSITPLQRDSNDPHQPSEVPPSVHEVLRSPGQSLDPATRAVMEPRFGHDFSQVRVHTGAAAERSAEEVSAKAYTVEHNIVFGASRFSPSTNEGQRLMAHELTHVVQQSGVDSIRLPQGNEKHDLSPITANHSTSLARDVDKDREWQAACVRRLGGCTSSKDGGLPSVETIKAYNLECRQETGYANDVTPTDEECRTAKEYSNAPLSYELTDAPISSDPKVRVERWLKNHQSEIAAAEIKFSVDRRAIAGAIAWEAIENIRGAWTPSSVGPGKVHIYKDLSKGTLFSEDTVAKQIEDEGILPKQNLEGRENILRTPSGAILYIAAIMKAGVDIAFEEGRFEISQNPEVLTWYYNSKDLPGWRALIKAKQRGSAFDTSPNSMSIWVKVNLALLEAAVGKPSFQPAHSPNIKLQKAPLDEPEPTTPAKQESTTSPPQVSGSEDQSAKLEPLSNSVTPNVPMVPAPNAPPVPAPNFTRDPGCAIEAPALPVVPTPLPFTLDPNAILPKQESAPDLSAIPFTKPWWADASAQAFGEKLAECYASRTATSPKPIDKTTKLAELQVDFDRVVQGSFGRAPKFTTWFGIAPILVKVLQKQRKKITDDEVKTDAKLPKDKRRSDADLNHAVEMQMQEERHNLVEKVRIQVALGTWAWMTERREKLDFNTIKQTYTGQSARLPELLTSDEIRSLVHGILVVKKRELTDRDIEQATTSAQAAKDTRAKQAKEPFTPLTEDEKSTAIAKAELDRVKTKWKSDLRTAMINARTTKDETNLVLPTKADVKGWSPDKQNTRIHKDIVALLKSLESEFPKGFFAGTYTLKIEGDHASGGFEGRFRSLDMYPNGGPSQVQKPFGVLGFFDKQLAFDFSLAIDRTVSGKGSYQILYNDFEVSREVNKVVKNGKMINIDNVTDREGHVANLNWHGPLVTHFHVDFAI